MLFWWKHAGVNDTRRLVWNYFAHRGRNYPSLGFVNASHIPVAVLFTPNPSVPSAVGCYVGRLHNDGRIEHAPLSLPFSSIFLSLRGSIIILLDHMPIFCISAGSDPAVTSWDARQVKLAPPEVGLPGVNSSSRDEGKKIWRKKIPQESKYLYCNTSIK